MSELALDFPNSQKHEATENPWDILAGQKFMEVNLETDDEAVKRLKLAAIANKQSFQTIAKEFCNDKEGALTDDGIDIYQDSYKPRDPQVEDAYVRLTETQLDLLQSEDQRDASSKRATAEEFANSLNPSSLGSLISAEIVKTSYALKGLHDIEKHRREHAMTDEGWIKSWIKDRHDRNEEIQTLKSVGYNPNGEQTEVFSLILQNAKAIRYGVPTRNVRMDEVLGYKRACDYQETMLLLDDEAIGSNCQQALKKAGYKELPEKWDDKNFSTSDIAEMCRIARSCESKE